MLHSDYRPLAPVVLPSPKGRQHYMHSFDASWPTVPEGFEDYLLLVVQLLHTAGLHSGEVHLTVDEKIVKAGMSQRRPKPHVDGCFTRGHWGHPIWSHAPTWLHNCNNVADGSYRRMPVIVAASVPGCRVWRGRFDGMPKEDGDLSHRLNTIDHIIPQSSRRGQPNHWNNFGAACPSCNSHKGSRSMLWFLRRRQRKSERVRKVTAATGRRDAA